MTIKAERITPKQQKFIDLMCMGYSQSAAYIEAFDGKNMSVKAVGERACVLFNSPKIKSRYDIAMAKAAQKLEAKQIVSATRVLEELTAIAFANGTDYAEITTNDVGQDSVTCYPTEKLTSQQRAAIVGMKNTRNGVEIKLADKMKALEILYKYLRMDPDEKRRIDLSERLVKVQEAKLYGGEDDLDVIRNDLSDLIDIINKPVANRSIEEIEDEE